MDYNSIISGPAESTAKGTDRYVSFSTPTPHVVIIEDTRRLPTVYSLTSTVSVSGAETTPVGLEPTNSPSTTLVEFPLVSTSIMRAESESTKITGISVPPMTNELMTTMPNANLILDNVASGTTSSTNTITIFGPVVTATATISTTASTSTTLQVSTIISSATSDPTTSKTLDTTSIPAVTTVTTASTRPSTTTTMRITTTMSVAEKTVLLKGICNTSYAKESSAFFPDGTLKNASQYGFWVEACGQQFLIGRSLVHWTENFINCYKIGMEPISLENYTKQSCFIRDLISKWNYPSKIWTSAQRVSSTSFSWCSKNGSLAVTFANGAGLWASGQPDNLNGNQNCTQLSAFKSNATLTLSDQMCTDKYFLACQGPPTSSPKIPKPVYPNIPCAINTAKFITVNNRPYLIRRSYVGSWITLNGRVYMFSYRKVTQTYAGAFQECCRIGMRLISFDMTFKYNALMNAIKTYGADGDYFWTSGIKTGSDGKFGFLGVQKPLRSDAPWEPGQPDNAGGIENAVAVYANASYASLFDFDEKKTMRYICEAIDGTQNNTGGTAASVECAFTYNVSQIEIDQLLNNTYNLDIRLKCFLRCMGEQAGLMVNGVYIDSQVLAILETMAQGNISELSQNVAVATECGITPEGMDECDVAAEIIRCSYDKSPNVVRGIITAVDQSLPMPPQNDFTTLQGQCPAPVCTINSTAQKIVADCTGNCVTPVGSIYNVCGKKWYKTSAMYTDKDNYLCACGEVGMKLASLENPDILKCMQNATAVAYLVLALFDIVGDGNLRWCPSNKLFSAEGFSNVTFDPSNRPGFMFVRLPSCQLTFTPNFLLRLLCSD
ncbi:uncharacterized protein LOC132202608 [Neocloeon triangulifer]|uniref:uncharacterized protein LOC132202608 n=1 Tax=Neocloeon triangulifer TaxID=2078957 RepID=UPI00286F9C96|nr:uncharacterized protein LOC132202608 [Neocloeon triangulifer]